MALPLAVSSYSFFGATPEELEHWVETLNLKPFVARQLIDWVYQKQVSDLEAMTNLSKGVKAQLAEQLLFHKLSLQTEQISQDGQTIKSLWKLDDGKAVESVLIMAPDRRTVCVSSQVGCPARCAFCASGKNGLLRNLTAHEIVEQVWRTDQTLRKTSNDEHVTNIVFMGMGEPLENYDNVTHALSILMHPKLMGFSKRRITVSTVGIEENIYRLADEGYGVELAFSLHAPTQKLREKIIPYARKYSLENLLRALRYYVQKTKRDITFEYTLIRDWNDRPEHAEALATLLQEWQCTVNLIPYNPVEGLVLQIPQTKDIEAFRHILHTAGIHHTCRYTKGRDIAAACGQLALKDIPLNPLVQ